MWVDGCSVSVFWLLKSKQRILLVHRYYPQSEPHMVTQATQTGHLRKMTTALQEPVRYELTFDSGSLAIDPSAQPTVTLQYSGKISCINCGRVSNKSFSQGYCYPCFSSLPECDTCIMSPEKCHFAAGTCRDPAWGETWCMQTHYVYLANSSGVKVGITRQNQIPTRWMDQGAIQAMAILKVSTRQLAGFAEAIIRQHVSDRTRWQAMLKGEVEPLVLIDEWKTIKNLVKDELTALQTEHGADAIVFIDALEPIDIQYPIIEHPTKVKSFNLDKTPQVQGVLKGIKGQYLILDTGVINIRKFSGYEVCVELS